MQLKRPHYVALAAAALVGIVVVIVLATGGDDGDLDGTTTTAGTDQTQEQDADARQDRQDRNAGNGNDEGGNDGGSDDSGGSGSSDDSSTEGSGSEERDEGDGTIQGFGEEASPTEAEAAAEGVRQYFDAYSRADGQEACDHLAEEARQGMVDLAKQSDPDFDGGCAVVVSSLAKGVAPKVRRTLRRDLEIKSVRVSGDEAFVIYKQKGFPRSFIRMLREDGEWLSAALGGSPLPGAGIRSN